MAVHAEEVTNHSEEVPDHPAFRTKHPGEFTFEKVLVVLAVITGIEVVVSTLYSDYGLALSITAILLVFFSLTKATMVGAYFMHLFYEKRPFVIFMIGFGFPMLIVIPIALMVVTV